MKPLAILNALEPFPANQLTRKQKESGDFIRQHRKAYAAKGAVLDGISRARVQHLRFSRVVIGGWAALNYLGVPYWCDAPYTWLHNRTLAGRVEGAESGVILRKCEGIKEVEYLDPLYPDLKVVEVGVAVIDCLVDIRSGRHREWTPFVDKLGAADIMSIQVLDAARTFLRLTWEDLERCGKGRVSRRMLRRYWKNSSEGMESPQETNLRLLIRDLAPRLEVQFQHFDDWDRGFRTLVTVSDLAWRHLKIAVFYDGRHHLEEGTRASDAEKTLFLQSQGWEIIRVTASMLKRPEKLRHTVSMAIEKQRKLLRV